MRKPTVLNEAVHFVGADLQELGGLRDSHDDMPSTAAASDKVKRGCMAIRRVSIVRGI